jgi:hypothetical protein
MNQASSCKYGCNIPMAGLTDKLNTLLVPTVRKLITKTELQKLLISGVPLGGIRFHDTKKSGHVFVFL